VIGGLVATLSGPGSPGDDPAEVVFGFTSPVIPGVVTPDPTGLPPTPTPPLDLALVPEPETSGLALCAIALFRATRRSRRR